MSTVEKGNKLEDSFYSYLCDQKNRGALVYDTYPSELCKIFKKRKYYCKDRNADVEFDVVIELFRESGKAPHLYVLFECKNHQTSIQERDVREFSDKISTTLGHSAKGVLVISSRLQTGADNVARNRKLGIVKFDVHGLDVIAERKDRIRTEHNFMKSQILSDEKPVKSLKFSAYNEGNFFDSIDQFIRSLETYETQVDEYIFGMVGDSVPFLPNNSIQQSAQKLLDEVKYQSGPVDLALICSALKIDLTFTRQAVQNGNGEPVLGTANFDHKSIQINSHDNLQRQRFTIGHEIGHFYLGHGRYLRSESIIEQDLFVSMENKNTFNYERLEYQSNVFASHLLLPNQHFETKLAEFRRRWEITDRGHGYLFVDDQPCNYGPYTGLMTDISLYFDISKQVIEIKLNKLRLLTDKRRKPKTLSSYL